MGQAAASKVQQRDANVSVTGFSLILAVSDSFGAVALTATTGTVRLTPWESVVLARLGYQQVVVTDRVAGVVSVLN